MSMVKSRRPFVNCLGTRIRVWFGCCETRLPGSVLLIFVHHSKEALSISTFRQRRRLPTSQRPVQNGIAAKNLPDLRWICQISSKWVCYVLRQIWKVFTRLFHF